MLGAGGAVGRAFHAGVLRALVDGCGWDAGGANLIVGTSAGAQVGALLRLGWTAHRLFRHTSAAAPPASAPAVEPSLSWPASKEYLRAVLARPWLARLGPLLAALLPEGTEGAARLGPAFSRSAPQRWPRRPLWIPAVHLDSGACVVFGRAGAPAADVATAVRCSSAVPGLSRPVRVGAERYVDGGVTSPTHAELVLDAARAAGGGRSVAVVLSPLSRFLPLRLLLRWELHPLARRGVEVLLFEPDRDVAAAMGWNPMNPRHARAVAELAYRMTLAQLQRRHAADAASLLAGAAADDRGR